MGPENEASSSSQVISVVLGQGHTLKTTALPKTAHSAGGSVYRDCRDDKAGRRWLEDLRSAKEGCLSGELQL